MALPDTISSTHLWHSLRAEAEKRARQEPALAGILAASILTRTDFADALIHILASELAHAQMDAVTLRDLFDDIIAASPDITGAAERDLAATVERDPASTSPLAAFLFFKGFQALQTYRFAHQLWLDGRTMLALSLQGRVAKNFAVDIHPAAQLGSGIMMDHANGIVIGETAVVEDDVSILHDVTLGGTGKESGDRHPKIRTGVMIGAGAKILGNIEIGTCVRIAAGSVVLDDVPPYVTVAGVPARVIGKAGCAKPSESMDQTLSGNKNSGTMISITSHRNKS